MELGGVTRGKTSFWSRSQECDNLHTDRLRHRDSALLRILLKVGLTSLESMRTLLITTGETHLGALLNVRTETRTMFTKQFASHTYSQRHTQAARLIVHPSFTHPPVTCASSS